MGSEAFVNTHDESSIRTRLRDIGEAVAIRPLDVAAIAQQATIRRARHRAFARTAIAVLVVAAVALPLWLLAPLDGSHRAPVGLESPSASITTSGLIEGGRLRCTVTFPHATVYPGDLTGATAELRRVSGAHADVSGIVTLKIISASGTVLADTSRMEFGINGPFGVEGPGSTPTVRVFDAHVLWPGTLSIVPMCPGGASLPRVHLQVVNPGKSLPDDLSTQKAVAAAGAPFSDCRPTAINQWVTGIVHRGSPPSDQSFRARCGAIVLENPGFDTVVLAIVSPPSAPSVNLPQLGERTDWGPEGFQPTRGESIAVSWWVYVVTRDRVTRVAQYSVTNDCEGLGGSTGPGVNSCRFPTSPSGG